MKRNSLFSTAPAQGTIEYLVILAVIIVISLVVVGLVGSNSNPQNIVMSSGKIGNLTQGGISIADALVATDGNGLVSLQNNSGDLLTITNISLGGVDNNYNTQLVSGSKILFSLKDLINACSCTGNEGTTKTCNATIYYTTQDGLQKTYKYSITVDCVESITPTDLNIIITPLDNIPPIIDLSSPADEYVASGNVSFLFNASDNNAVRECVLVVDGNDVVTQTGITNNAENTINYSFITNGDYSWTVRCTDYANNSATASPTRTIIVNFTGGQFECIVNSDCAPEQTCIIGSEPAKNKCYNGVLGYWRMEGNGDDSSPNGLNGSVSSATETTGLLGSAMSFNGNSTITLPAGAISNMGSGTLLIWYSRANTTDSEYLFSLRSGDPDFMKFDLGFENSSKLYFATGQFSGNYDYPDPLGYAYNASRAITSNTTIPSGQWELAAIVWGTNKARVYLNGNPDASGFDYTNWFKLQSNSASALFGGVQGSGALLSGSGFNGSIDEAILFNSTLSEAEIQTIMNNVSNSASLPETNCPSYCIENTRYYNGIYSNGTCTAYSIEACDLCVEGGCYSTNPTCTWTGQQWLTTLVDNAAIVGSISQIGDYAGYDTACRQYPGVRSTWAYATWYGGGIGTCSVTPGSRPLLWFFDAYTNSCE